MKHKDLTVCRSLAHMQRMKTGSVRAGVMAMVLSLGLAGCVTVEAPSEPIVIELNINITQEVIYRLAESATETIEENADIF